MARYHQSARVVVLKSSVGKQDRRIVVFFGRNCIRCVFKRSGIDGEGRNAKCVGGERRQREYRQNKRVKANKEKSAHNGSPTYLEFKVLSTPKSLKRKAGIQGLNLVINFRALKDADK